ncbi:MAG TPA: hypothetical protein VGQ03_07370, partial [Nitrososphaera sp.]|nr:hypothetical protein [Nitrososphaera sp.]
MPSRRVGLIGCGTIGSQLAIAIDSGKVSNATLVSLFDVVTENAQSLQGRLEHRAEIFGYFDRFLQSEIDTIIEAAS